jgi:hypothetical protein
MDGFVNTGRTARLWLRGLQVQVWRGPWVALIAYHRIPWFARDERGLYRTACDASVCVSWDRTHGFVFDLWHP